MNISVDDIGVEVQLVINEDVLAAGLDAALIDALVASAGEQARQAAMDALETRLRPHVTPETAAETPPVPTHTATPWSAPWMDRGSSFNISQAASSPIGTGHVAAPLTLSELEDVRSLRALAIQQALDAGRFQKHDEFFGYVRSVETLDRLLTDRPLPLEQDAEGYLHRERPDGSNG